MLDLSVQSVVRMLLEAIPALEMANNNLSMAGFDGEPCKYMPLNAN